MFLTSCPQVTQKSVCGGCGYVKVVEMCLDEAGLLVHPLSDGTESAGQPAQSLIDRHFSCNETKRCACPVCSTDTVWHFGQGVQCNAHMPRPCMMDPA